MFFFFKQKTAYEMRISDWSSDVCSSDLHEADHGGAGHHGLGRRIAAGEAQREQGAGDDKREGPRPSRLCASHSAGSSSPVADLTSLLRPPRMVRRAGPISVRQCVRLL